MDLMELFKKFRQRQQPGAQGPDAMGANEQAAYRAAMGGQGIQGGPPMGGRPPMGGGGGMPPQGRPSGPPQGAIGQAAMQQGGGDPMAIMQQLMAKGMPQEEAMMRAYQMAAGR